MRTQTLRAYIKEALPNVKYKIIDEYLHNSGISRTQIVDSHNPSDVHLSMRKQVIDYLTKEQV